tara:strand:+ start:521 stop:763 length:243 start_codon:yes stop_codon:yes gene_type:complete
MKTKHLDNEIERLNLMERTEDLSEYGQDMLNEFREIKQALNIPVVSESVTCFHCNGWGYTLLPNGKRDKHCTVCDGSNVR